MPAPSPLVSGPRPRNDVEADRKTVSLSLGDDLPFLIRAAVAAPLRDVDPVAGAPAADLDALVAVDVDDTHLPAAHVLDPEALRVGAVAGVLLDVGPVRHAGAVDVDAFAAVAVDDTVGPVPVRDDAERLRLGAIAAPLGDVALVGEAARADIQAFAAVLSDEPDRRADELLQRRRRQGRRDVGVPPAAPVDPGDLERIVPEHRGAAAPALGIA